MKPSTIASRAFRCQFERKPSNLRGHACYTRNEGVRPEWDSNPRITDLQSVPLVHLGIRPGQRSHRTISASPRAFKSRRGPRMPRAGDQDAGVGAVSAISFSRLSVAQNSAGIFADIDFVFSATCLPLLAPGMTEQTTFGAAQNWSDAVRRSV